MTLMLEIGPELEAALREVAEKEGVEPDRLAMELVREGLRRHRDGPPHLSRVESELLQQINQGLPVETWQRYHELTAKRRAETLTPEEHDTLITLSDTIEEWNARRTSLLVELARIRKVSLSELMDELGLTAPPYA